MDPLKIAELIQNQVNDAMDTIAKKTFYRGTVAAIKGRMVNVYIEGNTTATQNIVCLISYKPIVGDKVMVISIGNSGTNFLCLGKIDDTGLVINLITNPSAETNSNNFTIRLGVGGTTTDTGLPGGTKAFFLQNMGGGSADYITGNLVQGKQYTFSWYAKKFGSVTGTVTHNGATLYSSSAWTGAYVRYSVTFTATANAPLSLSIDIVGSDNTAYIDGLMLTEGSTLYTYFDGAVVPAGSTTAWDGTAHASTSRSYLVNTDNTWIVPPMTNSWVTYDADPGGWSAPGYMRDHMGFVHLRGLIKSGTVGAAAFTLPVGYRPTVHDLLIGTISNGAVGRVKVASTGAVTPESPSSNVWVALDGLVFKADDSGL